MKQSILGIVAMASVLVAVTYFLGRYKASSDLEETSRATAKAFRSRILEGDIKFAERQIRDVLKLQAGEEVQILDAKKQQIYKSLKKSSARYKCNLIGLACVTSYGQNAEIFEPIFFDNEGKSLFGYLYLSRKIQIDWIFLAIISTVFALGYLAVFFGVTQITKSTMRLLVDGLESWSLRLSKDPKDIASFSETPYVELIPLRRAIEGLNKKIEEYESSAAEKAKLLLLRGIAHDILNPVAQVQLYLATLKKKAEAFPEFEHLIAETEDSVQKVSIIAAQVKMLKNLPNPHDQVDVVSCLGREVETLMRDREILEKKIKLSFDSGVLQNVKVNLSEGELSRVLQNLVQNSAQASPDNSKIDISLTDFEGAVKISVRDYGHGIPQEIKDRVFQPDFTSRPGTGTGLGLSVVKHVAEARGGSVRLESSPLGTTIDVIFPGQLSEGASHDL